MRTTLTLEEDVSAQLQQIQRRRKIGWKALINEALRAGLTQLEAAEKVQRPVSLRVFDGGECLIGDFVSVSETLALVEGESFR